MIGFPRHTSRQSRSFICASNWSKSFENIRSSVNFCLEYRRAVSSALAEWRPPIIGKPVKGAFWQFRSDASSVSMLSATNLANLRQSSV